MSAELIAHGGKQLVLKIGVAAPMKSRGERWGQHRSGHPFVNGLHIGPEVFAGIRRVGFHPIGDQISAPYPVPHEQFKHDQ